MLSDEYTPTTEKVRSYYVEGRLSMHDGGEWVDESQFDRWLAARDAELIAERDAVIAEVREALAPGRPLYAALGAARAALAEKGADRD